MSRGASSRGPIGRFGGGASGPDGLTHQGSFRCPASPAVPRPPPRAGATSVSGSFGKPARIHSAWKARSASSDRPARRDAARDQVGAADRELGFWRVGEKAVGRGEGGIRRRRFGLGLSERERVARGLASGVEQERPQGVERRRRRDPVQADKRRGGGPQPVGFGVGETQPVAQPLRILRDRDAESAPSRRRASAPAPRPPRSRSGG